MTTSDLAAPPPVPGYPGDLPTTRYVEHTMGMPISLALRGRHSHDDAARAAWSQVMEELRAANEVFSTYRSTSFISRLNRGEIAVTDCPPEVAEVLNLAERARRESGGTFDIALTGPAGRQILDPSGVVKGWAVERASAALAALSDTDFCLSAGGDMTCRTLNPAGAPWRIGIEDPIDPGRVIAVVPVHTGAVATSGGTHRGPHIWDPRTAQAPTGVASVTVIARSLTWADIDATAAYAHGSNAARWLETRPGRTAFIVWADGGTSTTSTPHE